MEVDTDDVQEDLYHLQVWDAEKTQLLLTMPSVPAPLRRNTEIAAFRRNQASLQTAVDKQNQANGTMNPKAYESNGAIVYNSLNTATDVSVGCSIPHLCVISHLAIKTQVALTAIADDKSRQLAHILIDMSAAIDNAVFSKDEEDNAVKFAYVPFVVNTHLHMRPIKKARALGYWRVALFEEDRRVKSRNAKKKSRANQDIEGFMSALNMDGV